MAQVIVQKGAGRRREEDTQPRGAASPQRATTPRHFIEIAPSVFPLIYHFVAHGDAFPLHDEKLGKIARVELTGIWGDFHETRLEMLLRVAIFLCACNSVSVHYIVVRLKFQFSRFKNCILFSILPKMLFLPPKFFSSILGLAMSSGTPLQPRSGPCPAAPASQSHAAARSCRQHGASDRRADRSMAGSL